MPDFRVKIVPPFNVTGLDYTGALIVKTANNIDSKAYVSLFTCAVTRAVHLELVPDMTTRAFIFALRRFSSRRSLPAKMLSDNAATYLAASDELRSLCNSPEVQTYLAGQRVTWQFIPKRAPWFGGFWERLIGLTKNALKKTLGHSRVTFDELRTILTEIEAILNDRPLTYVSNTESDPIALTPSHLLNGRPLTSLPYLQVDEEELEDPSFGNHLSLNNRYSQLAKIQAEFWKRWSTEYLTALRERHLSQVTGSKQNSITAGDIVIVHDDITKRVNWKLAKVTKLIYGNDGLVRSADIQTAHGTTNRPIQKLYPLEVHSTTSTGNDEPMVTANSGENS